MHPWFVMLLSFLDWETAPSALPHPPRPALLCGVFQVRGAGPGLWDDWMGVACAHVTGGAQRLPQCI